MNAYEAQVMQPRPRAEAEPPARPAGPGGPPRARPAPVPGVLRVAAVASLVAGAVHATAAVSHAEETALAVVFALTAAAQLAWGTIALVRSGWAVSLTGVALSGTAVAGWALAKTTGIGFVAGLEAAEGPGFADTLAAALAALAVVLALAALARPGTWVARPHPTLVGVAGIAALALVVPGVVSAGGHRHEHGGAAGGDPAHGATHHGGGPHDMGAMPGMDHDHPSNALAPQPYTGKLPVDLGGVPGVTPAEQASAEAVVTRTIQRLPQFADPAVAEARGWHTIGDGFTGFEHLINWPLIEDHDTLDPDKPESLVYQMTPGQPPKLVAAMYMLPSSVPLDKVPDVGGPLVQWHIHDNLCFAGQENAWTVGPIVPPDQPCPGGTFRFRSSPMIHVWIVGNQCGPFAALEGISGGQIAEGQARLCDTAHGEPGAEANTAFTGF
ncbi:MAG TPA: hypothetical protein VKB57_25700 [Acidimicrobiales bacterium]|nr:hypothetical protein [Acidimicrobiales bacterium]